MHLTPAEISYWGLSRGEGLKVFNTQTVVICNIDLGALEIEREVGNVRPLVDRRPDIYVIENRITIEKCKVS